jgi:hypothetical protein
VQFRPNIPYVPVEAPPPVGGGPSVLAFSMAKAGSTLLYNMLSVLAPDQDLIYFSIEDYLFSRNVSPTNRPGNIGNVMKPTGYCYGGFRQFPAFPVPILHSSRVIFLVRDPRDMITSLYFSLLKSHRIPDAEKAALGAEGGAGQKMSDTRELLQRTDVNRFALEAVRTYLRIFEGYVAQGFAWRPNVAIYRYEDVIFEKAAWVEDICAWYDWDVSPDRQQQVAAMFDERPDRERPEAHVRQVTPGNYRQHLSDVTVASIDEALSEYMRLFGYKS